ncbi:guanylate-binding 4 [Olea europaea subsp. europaea]|uniref:Guanylate-binding 4 n=1 Tax=Olea europaea subsp. europaea TaxID=158383 RepID=A0A8S0R124_OLEEU|nr:guanylate-binding 4 [Olea europaea subsp. europaea]
MGNLSLPTSNDYLHNAHEASREAAMNAFNEQHFGRYHAKRSVEKLVEDIEKVYKNYILANDYQSSKLFRRLPSMAKFNARFLHCNQSFERECVGPSKIIYELRMMKM